MAVLPVPGLTWSTVSIRVFSAPVGERKNRVSEQTTTRTKKRELVETSIFGLLFVGQIVICVLFYNSAGLGFLVYLGWALLAVGFFSLGGPARKAFHHRGGAKNRKEWLQTQQLVESGIYAVIRHPMYLGFMVYVAALMLIAQHWLSVLLGGPVLVYLYPSMRAEERINLEKFGRDYRDYMQRVPRMNVLVGLFRLALRK